MAEITAAMVKSLREKTQLPMMECKKALVQSEGDEEKAIEILRKSGKAKMSGRTDRETAEGRIEVFKGSNGATAMIEIQCESAPVATNSQFVEQNKEKMLFYSARKRPGGGIRSLTFFDFRL